MLRLLSTRSEEMLRCSESYHIDTYVSVFMR